MLAKMSQLQMQHEIAVRAGEPVPEIDFGKFLKFSNVYSINEFLKKSFLFLYLFFKKYQDAIQNDSTPSTSYTISDEEMRMADGIMDDDDDGSTLSRKLSSSSKKLGRRLSKLGNLRNKN